MEKIVFFTVGRKKKEESIIIHNDFVNFEGIKLIINEERGIPIKDIKITRYDYL